MRSAPAFQVATWPLGIELEDGVVDDRLDQAADSAARFPAALLRLLPLGDVARHLGEADELAVVVTDRVDDDGGPEPLPSLRTRQPSA